MSVPVTGSCGRENHTLCTQAWCECDCHTAYRRPNMRYPSPSDIEMQAAFDDFWRPLVMPDGEWDMAQVVRELYDYKLLLDEVPKVYDHVTWGAISKPNTSAADVIAEHDRVCHSACGGPA